MAANLSRLQEAPTQILGLTPDRDLMNTQYTGIFNSVVISKMYTSNCFLANTNIFDNLLFVTENDYQCMLSQLYHENSKVGRKKYEFESKNVSTAAMANLNKITNGKGKDYSFHKSVDISSSLPTESQRRSRRNFISKPLRKDSLLMLFSNLMAYSMPDNSYRKNYPSAGALYAVEMYPIIMNVEDCLPGLYYLDAYKQKLMQLNPDIDLEKIKSMFMDEEAVLNANLIILMTAVLPRLQFKYGERAYRYAHLEAGHLSQLILEQCHTCKLAAFPVGGFIEREIENYLDIDGHEEIAVYSVIIGQTNDY